MSTIFRQHARSSDGRAAQTETKRPSAAWILVLLLAAALLWLLVSPLFRNTEMENHFKPFPEMNFAPLIEGEGLGQLTTDFSAWPDDEPVAVGLASDRPEVTVRPRTKWSAEGERADRRPNGSLEHSAAAGFLAWDRNGDGRISPAEFAIFRLDGLRPGVKGYKADDTPPYISTDALNQVTAELGRIDADNDWFVSPAEFALVEKT